MKVGNLSKPLVVSLALTFGIVLSNVSLAAGRNQNIPGGLPLAGGLPLVGGLPIVGGGSGVPIVGGIPVVGGVVNGGVGGLANGAGVLNLGRNGNVGVNPTGLGLNTGVSGRGDSRHRQGGDINIGGIGIDLGRNNGTRRYPDDSNIGLDFGGSNNSGLLGRAGKHRR